MGRAFDAMFLSAVLPGGAPQAETGSAAGKPRSRLAGSVVWARRWW
ncbi:MAG TPA: hypothetical protein VEU08_21315 [Vicinamibacterales bacterium]|nr:hypothetical protein [Vicinamibacterales bacterium]